MKRVRIGMIGAGGIAREHMKSLRQIEEAELAGIYDINQGAADRAAADYGFTRFDNPYGLIDKKHIDVLFVCTPPFAREEYETKAAERGIHLFTEKPLGLDLSEVERKAGIIGKSGIISSTGHSNRYLQEVQRAKRFLADKQIDLVHVVRYHGLPEPRWFWKMETCGGMMVDQTIHEIDLVRYLAGEFSEVYAVFELRSLHKQYEGANIYDVGTVAFRLASGAVGSVTQSNLLGAGKFPSGKNRDVTLIGADFAVIINRKEVTIIHNGEQYTTDPETTRGENPMTSQDRAFIRAVNNETAADVLCSYEEGFRSLKVVLAMNESAQLRQAVQL